MAHSPQTKAKVIADVVKGMSFAKAEQKHGVPKATISRWFDEAGSKRNNEPKTEQKRNTGKLSEIRTKTPAERQREEFDKKLVGLLMSSLDMLEAWAKTCQDEKFITKNPGGANELGRTVLERCDRLLEVVRANIPDDKG